MEKQPTQKFPCPLCVTDCSRTTLPGHLTRRHFNCDLDQLNAGLEAQDRFIRCPTGCGQFLRAGARGMSKHQCKEAGSRASGTDELENDLVSLMSDRSESIGSDRGPGIISTGDVTAGINGQEGIGNQEVGSTTGEVADWSDFKSY